MSEVINIKELNERIERESVFVDTLRTEMGKVIVGQSNLVDTLLIGLLSNGHILLEGRDITAIPMEEIAAFRREALGFVFQEFNLLDTLTLEENMALPLTIRELEPAEIRVKVHALADRLGLSEALGKFPYQVSGGQKQRCAFARAVIGEPKLILADEPTGNLDSESGSVVITLLKKLVHEQDYCVIIVTHDLGIAAQADKVYRMLDGKLMDGGEADE